MQKHLLYKIISFLFLPIAALLGLSTLVFLVVALANPPMLLGVFVLACVVIYIITSFIFLNKAIMLNHVCKRGLKDWIKVNAYVSIVFCFFTIFQLGGLIMQPELMDKMIRETTEAQASYRGVSKEMMMKTVKAIIYFVFAFALVLLIHIFNTLRLLKMYRHLFDDATSPDDPQQ